MRRGEEMDKEDKRKDKQHRTDRKVKKRSNGKNRKVTDREAEVKGEEGGK